MSHEYGNRRPRETLGPANPNITNIPVPQSAKRSNSSNGFYGAPPGSATAHSRTGSSARMSMAMPRPGFAHASPMVGGLSAVNGGRTRHSMMPPPPPPSSAMASGSSGPRRSMMPGATMALSTPARRASVLPPRATPGYTQTGMSMGLNMVMNMGMNIGMNQPVSTPLLANVSFFSVTQPSLPAPDQKLVRSPAVRSNIAHEIIQYMQEMGFERETKIPVPDIRLMLGGLPGPTITVLFKWLYHRVDPGYVFPPASIENFLPNLLKQLRCPWERTMSRSQLLAPQPATWRNFLGMFQWLMHLAKMMAAFASGQYDHASEEAGYDVATDRIGFEFISNAYYDWMMAGDDEDDEALIKKHVRMLQDRFQEANGENIEQAAQLEAENNRLQEEFQRLQAECDKLEKNDQISSRAISDLSEDRGKFDLYNQQLETRNERQRLKIKTITEELEKKEVEAKEAEEELREIQEIISGLGLSVTELERKAIERERFQRQMDSLHGKLEDARIRASENEAEADQLLEELEYEVEQYSKAASKLELIPVTAKNAFGMDLNLGLTVDIKTEGKDRMVDPDELAEFDRLVGWRGVGHQPATTLNQDVRSDLWMKLNRVRSEAADRKLQSRDGDVATQEKLQQMQSLSREKESEIESLKHRVQSAQAEYERLQNVSTQQKNTSASQIEQLEHQLAKVRQGLDGSVQLAEQEELQASLRHQQMVHEVSAIRDQFHSSLGRLLDDVLALKLHVQGGLEGYESFVVGLAGQEWGEGAEDEDGYDEGDEDDSADGYEENGGDEAVITDGTGRMRL